MARLILDAFDATLCIVQCHVALQSATRQIKPLYMSIHLSD